MLGALASRRLRTHERPAFRRMDGMDGATPVHPVHSVHLWSRSACGESAGQAPRPAWTRRPGYRMDRGLRRARLATRAVRKTSNGKIPPFRRVALIAWSALGSAQCDTPRPARVGSDHWAGARSCPKPRNAKGIFTVTNRDLSPSWEPRKQREQELSRTRSTGGNSSEAPA